MSMLMQAGVEEISINTLPYKGGYVIEITDDTRRNLVPKTARIDGEFITVDLGRITKVGNGFSFAVGDNPEDPLAGFFFMDKDVRMIRNGSGRPIWTHPTLR